MPTPNRGEVWVVDLGMAGKVRPCLVLSVPAGPRDRALTTLVAGTTSIRSSDYEVVVQARFLHGGVAHGNRLAMNHQPITSGSSEMERDILVQIMFGIISTIVVMALALWRIEKIGHWRKVSDAIFGRSDPDAVEDDDPYDIGMNDKDIL